MKLKRVIRDIEFSSIKGSKEVEILGISSHSKSVAPGFLFIAKKGRKNDGAEFIADAIAAGAVAIVTDLYNPFYQDVVQLIHPRVEEIEGLLAKNFYKDPSTDLFLVGITGTSGKTTTSYMVKHLLELAGPTGLMGTIEIDTGAHRVASSLTTPDVVSTHKFLREMVTAGCKHAVMEVTSIGIDQKRIAELEFDVAIFTNLTPEHLDYHKDFSTYAAVKEQFLISVKETRVINKDSILTIPGFTYSLEDPQSDLYATDIEMHAKGTTFLLTYKEKTYSVEIPLIGRHNVYNTLGAVGAALAKGIPIKRIIERLKTLPEVPGRLEQVAPGVFVDYAHKPDALEKVLKTVKELGPRRLILVFGCGGDRDPFKRPMMAKIAEQEADIVIVTSDNPRSEDPKKIIEDIVRGFSRPGYCVEEDRRAAITKALLLAKEGDFVIIAGKGHETGQTIGSSMVEFDDRIVVQEMLCAKS